MQLRTTTCLVTYICLLFIYYASLELCQYMPSCHISMCRPSRHLLKLCQYIPSSRYFDVAYSRTTGGVWNNQKIGEIPCKYDESVHIGVTSHET